ncbi:MAG: ATP-binding protein [Actinomycetota bacterium]
MAAYRPRAAEGVIRTLLSELPAVMVVGPRATGKTTLASRLATTVIRLDRPAEAAAFQADPDAALRGLPEPVLLDEWQAVPDVLGAVKRAVDAGSHPGRYLLTGSIRADLQAVTWPGTGRLIRVPLYGLTVAEQLERPDLTPFLDRLGAQDPLLVPKDPPDLRGYVEIALRGGFPEAALAVSRRAGERWLGSYVDQLLTRDAPEVAQIRDPARLRRYFEAYALNSAGVADDKTIYDPVGINRLTALGYEQLLTNLLTVEALPSWTSNRLKRLTSSPKRYVVDPGLMAGVLRVDATAVMRDGDLLGRFLDTFVVAQIRGQSAATDAQPRLFHLRQEQGRHELDLVAELTGRRIVAMEVKATSAPRRDDARHLEWFRDQIGEAFVAGVVLHTGPRVFELGDRIIAAPISTLWG